MSKPYVDSAEKKIKMQPEFNPLRSDARSQALLRRMNCPR